ncbi:hypothetical protein Fmac_009830 [Flemingia macrophylla]|uniref:DUF7865 domain-containing protein n=1 Tax=Flemingia macrophylla TaxID=520843 RepID=A0ABD1N1E5_9FABA
MRTGSSAAFAVICMLHSAIAVTSGALMMFYMKEVYTLGHGVQTATRLLGSTPHDQLLIKTSDSFSGLLLVAIGFLLFMVSFVRDRDFQAFFAKGCTLLHLFMAVWRVYFERKVQDLAWDWLRQTVGDLLLALSWLFFLLYSWRENWFGPPPDDACDPSFLCEFDGVGEEDAVDNGGDEGHLRIMDMVVINA